MPSTGAGVAAICLVVSAAEALQWKEFSK